ncbi:unnamed protein product [Adineta steineri]|uniref:JmjC domain-containing protein n=1 Tax=Adineta steineri TaxID=433720 RepID=A0A819UF02_9BILA|nr:unnamed protein product [Adineta steineri]CAF4095947.1 unnamed protein product [Adineta steineri]
MNQYINPNKLVTYLHSNSTDTFLDLKSESIESPSSNASTLLQQNSSLIDLCAFNSLYQRLVETSPSSSDTSTYDTFITSSDLSNRIPLISQIDQPIHSNGMFVPSLHSTDNRYKTNNNKSDLATSINNSSISATVPLSPTYDKHSRIFLSTSNSSTRDIVQQNSPYDSYLSNDLSKVISNKRYDLSMPHLNDNDNTLDYELSSFISKTEQTPSHWMMGSMNLGLIQDNGNSPKHSRINNEQIRKSPVLHRALISSPKQIKTHLFNTTQSMQSNTTEPDTTNIHDSPNNKSPQYRPRHSYIHSLEAKLKLSSNTIFQSENNLNKKSKFSQRSCRSPVYTRRPQQQKQNTTDTNFDTTTSSRSSQPMALLSLDINGSISPINNESSNQHQIINSSLTLMNSNNKKRLFESSTSEQILIKRRYQRSVPINIIQKQYCISYPINVQRCVDCQMINSSNSPLHLLGCRFQHCRTLKYLGDDKYEIEGFTTDKSAKSEDIAHIITPNSGGQPALNLNNSNYILTQIAKLFCLIFSYEETQQSIQNDKEIIWKRCIPGWREVCDECLTTLFNYHYMCKICGYMICVECSDEFFQANTEKRKKLKRTCYHLDSYCLSEFIPWNILVKQRKYCIDYLSKLKIDHSTRFLHTSKNENYSIFIKSLKIKRIHDIRNTQKIWSSIDCNYDSNIEFYCNGRLPVFNEWTSENAKRFFQRVWAASCPVLVKQVHHNLSKTLWHPDAFKLHMLDHHDTPALWDCETLTPIQTNETILTRFWDGFERLNIRLRDNEHRGRVRILKLKDWPTKKDFASVFPTRLHDLMTNIPFSDYTRRSYTYNGITYHGGAFNIVERLPACSVKPDLGPKLYIAYSQLTSQATRKAGTTNLHIDVSDAVNVLVYVGIGGQGDDGLDKDEEIRQVETEILNSNIDELQLQRLRNGERPGALWHLFRSDDVKTIREYIGRTQRKTSGSDEIHDQTAYLEKEDLENLKCWNQVEAYPILQFLGDAVFIPSGAPHQVRNLHSCIKIAEDFVSPENLDRCLITTNEFRSLSKTHTNHADILQAKNILYYATRDALNSLGKLPETLLDSSTYDNLN